MKFRFEFAMLCATYLFVMGCATPDVQPAPQETRQPPPPVDPRAAEMFQKRCDDSMLQAALARWSEGDVDECQSLLERLLNRNPAHVEARMALADLQLSQDNVPAAESQLRWLVHQNPQNPQARHSLGLLLDSTGRHSEAMEQLREAARLDPQNALYAMCEQAALGQMTAGSQAMVSSIGAPGAGPPSSTPLSTAHSNHTAPARRF